MKRYLFFLALCIVMLQAQQLALHEVIDKTLAHHPALKTLVLQTEQSRHKYRSSRADYLPQISLQGEYDPLKTYVLPVNGTFHTTDDDGYSIGAVLKQTLWDFSKTDAKVAAAKKDRLLSELSLQDAQAAMRYEVTLLYELMLLQHETITVRQQDVSVKEAFYKQAKALVAQGLKTEADASRFLSAWYDAQDALATAQSLFDKTRTTLSLYMGEPIESSVTLTPVVMNETKAETLAYDVLQQQMLQENLQLKIAKESVEKNRLLYRSSKASRYGSLDAIASYTYQNTLNSYDATLLGVTLNIPLYLGGRLRAESQQARIGVGIAAEQRNATVLTLQNELQTLLIDLKRYTKSMEAKEAQLVSARQTQEIVQARYHEGLSTYIELLDAVTTALNAKLGVLEVRNAQHGVLHRIHYLIGMTE